MNNETFKKAEILYTKLATLIANKEKLIKSKGILDITIREGSIFTNYIKVNLEYLDFSKLKTFLLEEINKEISKTQKELDKL